MATAERAAASAVVTSAAEVDALVYEHLLARGYVATAKSLQAEAREEEAETASTDWVSDLHMFVQANDQADWVRYIAKLRERDSTLRKAVHTIYGMAVSLSSDLYSTIPPEDGGPDNGGHVFPIKLLQGTQAYLQKIKKEIQEHCSTRIQKPAALVAILKKRALKAHPSGRTLVRIDSSFLHGSHVPKADLQVPASIAEDGAGEGEGDAVPITSSSSGAADSAAGAASAASLASESPRERAGSSMDGEQPSATKPTAPTPAEGQPQPRRVSQMSRSDSPEPVVPTPLPPTSGAGDKPPVARGGRKYVPALEASVRQGLKEEEEGFAAGVEGDPWRSVVAVAFLKRASWRPPPLHFDTLLARWRRNVIRHLVVGDALGMYTRAPSGAVVPAKPQDGFLAQLVRWEMEADASGAAGRPHPDPRLVPHRLIMLGVRLLAELTATEDGRLYLVNATTLFGERDARIRATPLSGIAVSLWHVVLAQHRLFSPGPEPGLHESTLSLRDSFCNEDDLRAQAAAVTRQSKERSARHGHTREETCMFRWAVVALERLSCFAPCVEALVEANAIAHIATMLQNGLPSQPLEATGPVPPGVLSSTSLSYLSALLYSVCVYVFKPENSLDQLGTEMLTAGWDQTDVTDGARLPLLDVIEDLLGVLEHLVNVRVAGTDQPVFFAVPVLHTVSRAVTGTIFTLLRQPSLLGFVRVSRHLRISERLLRLAESLQGPVFDSSTNASAPHAVLHFRTAVATLLKALDSLDATQAAGPSQDTGFSTAPKHRHGSSARGTATSPSYTVFSPSGDVTVSEGCLELPERPWDWTLLKSETVAWQGGGAGIEPHQQAVVLEERMSRLCGAERRADPDRAGSVSPHAQTRQASATTRVRPTVVGGGRSVEPKAATAAAVARDGGAVDSLFGEAPPSVVLAHV